MYVVSLSTATFAMLLLTLMSEDVRFLSSTVRHPYSFDACTPLKRGTETDRPEVIKKVY